MADVRDLEAQRAEINRHFADLSEKTFAYKVEVGSFANEVGESGIYRDATLGHLAASFVQDLR